MEEYILPLGLDTNPILQGFKDMENGLDRVESKANETRGTLKNAFSGGANAAKNLDDTLEKVAPTLKNISDHSKRIENDLKGMKNATSQAFDEKPLNRFQSGLQKLKNIFNDLKQGVKLGISDGMKLAAKDAEDLAKKTTKAANDSKSSFGGLGTMIAGVFGGNIVTQLFNGVVNLGSQVIETTATFQKMEAVLTNTLGNNSKAKRAMNDIVDFAAKTPFQVDELTDSFIKFANRGIVLTQKEMTKLGDIAASQGKSFNQLTEAILDAQTGEFERLKEFGIRGSKAGDQVTFSFKGVTTTVKNSADEIKNALEGFGDLKGVKGGMEAISLTVGGQISNLKDNISGLFKDLGDGTGSFIAKAVSFFNGFINILRGLPKFFRESKDELLAFGAALLVLNSYSIAQTIGTWIVQLATYTLGTKGAAAAQALLAGATRLLNIALQAGIAIAAFMVVRIYQQHQAYKDYLNTLGETATKTRLNTEIQKRATEAVVNEIAQVEILKNKLKNKNLTRKEQIEILNQLKALNPRILKDLTLENLETEKGIGLLKEYVKQLYDKAEARATEDLLTEKIKNRIELANKYNISIDDLNNNLTGSINNIADVKDKLMGEKQDTFLGWVGNTITGTKSEAQVINDELNQIITATNEINVLTNQLGKSKIKTGLETPTKPGETPADPKAAAKAKKDAEKQAKEDAKKALELEKSRADLLIKYTRELKDAEIEAMENGYAKERAVIEENFKRKEEDLKKEHSEAIKKKEVTKEAEKQYLELLEQNSKNKVAKLKELKEKEDLANVTLQLEASKEILTLQADSLDKELQLIDIEFEDKKKAVQEKYKGHTELIKSLEAELDKAKGIKKTEATQSDDRKKIEEAYNVQLAIAKAYGNKMLGLENHLADAEEDLAKGNKRTLLKIKNDKNLLEIAIELAKQKELLKLIENDPSKKAEIEQAKARIEGIKKEFEDAVKNGAGTIKLDSFFDLSSVGSGDVAGALSKAFTFKLEGKQSMADLLGLDSESSKAITDSFTSLYSVLQQAYSEMIQSQIDEKDRQIEALDEQISKAEELYNHEEELQKQGYANNANAKAEEVAKLKEQRDKEQAEKEALLIKQNKMAQTQIAVQTAVTVSSMIVGLVQAMTAPAAIPIVGVAMGIAAAAALLSGILAIKAKAKEIKKEGGYVEGRSHDEGGEKYYSSTNKILEIEGGEFVTKKRQTKKFGRLLEAINNDNFTTFNKNDDAFRNMLHSMGIRLEDEEIEKTTNDSKEVQAKEIFFTYGKKDSEADKYLKSISDNTQILANEVKNKIDEKIENGYKVTKQGNVTRRVKLNEV